MPRKRKPYTIRYGILDPSQISDSVLVFGNPGYGTRIGDHGSRPVGPDTTTYRQLQQKNQFFTKLVESIKKEGIRNPIFCQSMKEGTFSRYGTTRLWVAKKYKLKVPCVIADYTDRWDELQKLSSKAQILSKYMDKPEILEINQDSMRIDACPHHHLSP